MTGFSTQLSDRILRFTVFQTFLFAVARFKLLTMPKRHAGCFIYLVAGSERREDKNKEI